MIKQLKSTQLFGGIDEKYLKEITEFVKVLTFPHGTTIFEEGDKADFDLYLLLKGSLDVISQLKGVSNNRSQEMLLMSSSQELVGEVAFILKTQRTAHIRARGNTEVMRIDGKRLDEYMLKNPGVGYVVMRRMLEVLATKLTNTNTIFKMIMKNSFPL